MEGREALDDRITEEASNDRRQRHRSAYKYRERRDEHDQIDRDLPNARAARDLGGRCAAVHTALKRDPRAEPERETGRDARAHTEKLEDEEVLAGWEAHRGESRRRDKPGEARRRDKLVGDVLPDLVQPVDGEVRGPHDANGDEEIDREVPELRRSTGEQDRTLVSEREPYVIREYHGGGERHRRGPGGARLPARV